MPAAKNTIGNTRADEGDEGRAFTEEDHFTKVHSISASSPTITMSDPTLSIPVPSEDPKPKDKQEPESNDAKQKQKGEKEQEDLVCLSSVLHSHVRGLKFRSQKRIFNSRMSSKCS